MQLPRDFLAYNSHEFTDNNVPSIYLQSRTREDDHVGEYARLRLHILLHTNKAGRRTPISEHTISIVFTTHPKISQDGQYKNKKGGELQCHGSPTNYTSML